MKVPARPGCTLARAALLLAAGCSSAADASLRSAIPSESGAATPDGTRAPPNGTSPPDGARTPPGAPSSPTQAGGAPSSMAEVSVPPAPEFDPSPFDPPLEPLPPGVVLRWSFTHALHGKEFIEVQRDGRTQVVLTDPHGFRHLASPKLSAAELTAIAKVLRESAVCSVRSRRYGIPDEVRPTMRIRLDGLTCDVTLWDGEWTDPAIARGSTAWVASARAQVHGR